MKNLLLIPLFLSAICACTPGNEQLAKRADRIHECILTVDTHCDTPMEMVSSGFDPGVRHEDGCVDFPRMKEGGLTSEFFAVFTQQGPLNDSAYALVHKQAIDALEAIHTSITRNSAMAGIATTPEDASRIKKEGRIAAFIGIENGYPLGKDISVIKEFYDLGARYITLAHTKNNDICDSSTDSAGPLNNGLSDFGKKVVKEMNRLGMMIDVSHISDKSFYDVLKYSRTPVIASHSSCRALCQSPRNLTDEMLLALKKNGGVIQICILSDYIKTPAPNPELAAKQKELQEKYGDVKLLTDSQRKAMRADYRELRNRYRKLATVRDVVDHIDHVVQVIGIDYVGIGTDFDGGGGVEGCKSVADMKNITIELLRRGYSKSDITKIWGGNIMRVLKEVEQKREADPTVS